MEGDVITIVEESNVCICVTYVPSHWRFCPYAYWIALFSLQFTLQYNHACQPRFETASASLTWMTH